MRNTRTMEMDVRTEGSLWESALFGDEYPAFLKVLSAEEVLLPNPAGRLSPMAEILWSTAFQHSVAPDTFPEGTSELLQAALVKSSTPIHNENLVWMPVSFFFLRYIGTEFEDGISILLNRIGLGPLDIEVFRFLCHLFFHPLQNIQQHASAGASASFAGVTTRIVESPYPQTPAVSEYRESLGLTDPGQRFLEMIFHDEGVGIAEHFYRSQARSTDAKPFEALHPTFEWARLNQAFERHATSKDFERRTTTDIPPGVGLASLMRSLKTLRGFLELRSGRYRVYRWFASSDIIPRASMLLPTLPPEVLSPVKGTILRLFIPIP